MTVTVTDLFCSAGGSSTGAVAAGAEKDRVKLAGNAVTPPVATWTVGRLIQALEQDA